MAKYLVLEDEGHFATYLCRLVVCFVVILLTYYVEKVTQDEKEFRKSMLWVLIVVFIFTLLSFYFGQIIKYDYTSFILYKVQEISVTLLNLAICNAIIGYNSRDTFGITNFNTITCLSLVLIFISVLEYNKLKN